MLQEREHGVIGPVEVLDDQHQRAIGGHALDERAPGGERLFPVGGRRLQADERQHPFAQPGLVGPGGTTASSFAAAVAGESDSRIPACAFTISPSAQKVIPSPYGRQRPWCQVTGPARLSTCERSSATIRLLPMPASPMTVTSRTGVSAPVASNSRLSSASSSSAADVAGGLRPGQVHAGAGLVPMASKIRTGSALPFRLTGSSSRYSMAPRVASYVPGPPPRPSPAPRTGCGRRY